MPASPSKDVGQILKLFLFWLLVVNNRSSKHFKSQTIRLQNPSGSLEKTANANDISVSEVEIANLQTQEGRSIDRTKW
jgi:hypothetical protein